MTLLRAHEARLAWDSGRKRWHVDIHVGAEVIKRPLAKEGETAGDEALRSRAVEIAKDEGYELDAARVVITR